MARLDRPRDDAQARLDLEELEAIYRSAPVGLCLVDPQLRFVRINERMASINGHAVEDHIGRTVEEILPDLASQIVPRYRKVLLTGEAIDNVEVTDARGERIWRVSDRPVKAATGEVSGIITVVQEITDLVRGQEELRKVRERLRRAEQVAGLGCWEWNLQTDEVWWSNQEYR
ncbi:MAG: PAS domain-containing protein, partial [Myxococcales bacterium]|nr:PAS domain-containing protein [Myxococcales bacterium]